MQLLQHFKELTVRPKNAQELKGLILQLAIQGKLTANWRKENPTIKLNNEKLTGISEKTLSFLNKESESINQLDVPSTWLKLKFRTLFEMQGGSQPPKSKFSSTERDGYVRLYQIRDFGKRPVPVYVPEDSVSKRCTEDDVMIGRYGASIGKIFYGKNGAYNVALVRLIWSRELLEQNFVYQIFSSYYMQEFFQNCTRSAQAGFNKTDMGKLNIPLPPLEEQKEIVNVVETLFKEVEQLEQLTVERINLKEDFVTSALNQLTTNNANQEWVFLQDHFKSFFNETSNIKKLRETVLQLAVQGKLTADWRASHPELVSGSHHASQLLKRIQEEKAQLIADKKIKKEKALPPITKEEIPYGLPEGWVWCRLQDVFKDLRYGTSKKCGYKLGVNPVLRIPNLKKGGIDITDLKTTTLSEKELKDLSLTKGDLLIIRSNGSENLVGRSSVVTNVGIGYSFAGYLVRLQVFTNHIDSSYLHTVLESSMIRTAIEGPLRTTSGVKNINSTEISKLIIPIPPLEEQKAIVEKVNALMGLCDRLEQEVQQSQEHSEMLMQSCLREVFEGEKELI
ncbi:restriction endonuclease subunit S [Winogradskyella sediminis]|uniref:restriction endonuclease subunit S n=1 Tax=Winogradskyella sediminis TaxID=1382466 RepID=UPI003AA7B70E